MDRPDLYDPGQAICVWPDALGDYLTALGFGTGGGEYRRWWAEAQLRIAVIPRSFC
ncbi:MAG TPA: hypothetical protein VF933_35210 [Streptosporangiaceae bacterium]